MMKVLFVCTGNIFRSFVAEQLLNHYARENDLLIKASSAGVNASLQEVHPATIEALKKHGLNRINHKKRTITARIIEASDKIVAMGLKHQAYIKKRFNIEALLFKELIEGNKESVKDIKEALPGRDLYSQEVVSYINEIVNYIHDSIPVFINKLSHV